MGNRKTEYINRETGEVTTSHREAVEWYRNGSEVEVWSDGKFKVAWVM